MTNFNPKNPSKYLGTNKYITFFVSRNRSPTGADYRQPETGTLYSLGTVWQVGKDPSTGSEGDLWVLSKIVANVAYWVQIGSGITPSGAVLSLSDTADTLVYPTVAGNIQLEGTAGEIDVTSDAVNNKIVFSLPGGGGSVDSFTVQAITAPGVNPVTPTALGVVTVNAAAVANHSVVMETRSRALNAYNIEVQYATSAAATDATKSGVCHFDSTDFSVDASGFVSLAGAGAGQTITGQSGGALVPTAGNWNIYGLGEMTTSGSVSTLSILQPRACKFIVDPTQYYGTHQTLTAALAAASSGDTILIRTSITEDVTLKAGVNICGLPGSGELGTVTITGKLSASFAGSCSISDLRLKTNSDFALSITGANATIVNVFNSYIVADNNTAVQNTCSDANSELNFYYTQADTSTTGIAHFSDSSAGIIKFFFCDFRNTGASSTANTKSAGQITARSTNFRLPLTYSSSSSASSLQQGACNTAAQNATCLTTSGTGAIACNNMQFSSGTASAISVGAGTVLNITNSGANSSNAFVLTGAGTMNYGYVVFTGSSAGHNVSTETAFTVI